MLTGSWSSRSGERLLILLVGVIAIGAVVNFFGLNHILGQVNLVFSTFVIGRVVAHHPRCLGRRAVCADCQYIRTPRSASSIPLDVGVEYCFIPHYYRRSVSN